MSAAGLEIVSIPGATSARRSAVATPREARGTPVVLLHGIFDSVHRWTGGELEKLGLPDRKILAVPFDVEALRPSERFGYSPKQAMPGLLPRLAAEGIPAIGFSYQEGLAPVAPMAEAVAATEKVALFAMERWNSDRVSLLGYSRGGLVARHAAGLPSLAGRLDRLVTLCTPHLGSGIANMAVRIEAQIARFREFALRLVGARDDRTEEAAGAFEEFLNLATNLAGLSPESPEVRDAPTPEFPGGVFALAGSVPTYFRASIFPAPDFELPPAPSGWLPRSLRAAEFAPTAGDGAVTVASALGYPGQRAERTLVLPVNHMQAAFCAAAHDRVTAWLREPVR
ncbi:MAG TPA: hypothetical protein VNC50_02215 [Planctomycetia bacterium]|nr:hypothetical protein [Planctomycetia bacterium]